MLDTSGYRITSTRSRAQRLIRKADRARDRGDYSDAASLYRRALALDHRRADIRVQLAHMLKELSRFGEAEAAYRQASEQMPDDADVHLQLGRLLTLLGRTEEADVAYAVAHRLGNAGQTPTKALRVPDAPVPRTASAGTEEHIRNGDRLRDAGRYAEAAEAYGNALALAQLRTDIRLQYGNMLKDSGRLAEAEAVYRAGLAQTPGNAELYLQLGHALKLQGRRDEAVAAYRRATELQPSLDAAWGELFHAGDEQSQRQLFAQQVARGGVEAVLALTEEVVRLQGAVARLAEALPGLYAQTAFPLTAYDRFRSVYDVPAPPRSGDDRVFGIVLTAPGAGLETLYSQIASVSAQSCPSWQLRVIGTEAAHRQVVERAAASDPRIAWVEGSCCRTGGTGRSSPRWMRARGQRSADI